MKLLYDYFPILLFFIAYKLAGIYTATAVAMLAAVAQVAHFWFKHKRFENMHLVSLVLITVLGGLTLILRDKSFFMWKPTMVNWLFAAAFLVSAFIGSKPLIRRMLDSQIDLPTAIWARLNYIWVIFFLVSGAINIYFVKDYQAAEQQLRIVEPQLDAAKLSELNCDTDYSEAGKVLCLVAREKEEFWVNFKLFGMLGLTFIFILVQGVYLYRHMTPPEEEEEEAS